MNTVIHSPLDLPTFERHAGAVAVLLRTLGNGRRLMIMCKLAEHGELTVGHLAHEVGLSQSALSQHLAKLRDQKLVAFRRESQSAYYRIADARCEALMATLYQLYCQTED